MTVSPASPFDRAVPTLPFALLTPFVSHRAVACADTDIAETDSAVIEVGYNREIKNSPKLTIKEKKGK